MTSVLMLDPPLVMFWSTVLVKLVLSTKKNEIDSYLQSLDEIKPLLLYLGKKG